MSLSDQLKNFKKSMSASTLVGVKRTATQSTSAADAPPTPKYGGITNNTRAAFESSQPHPKKKTKKAPVYSQPANTGTGQHLMSQLYTVIQFLKEHDTPQSIISIRSRTGVDIVNNAELWDKLVHNDKIDFDSLNKTFAYKPAYSIKSKEDLLNLLIEKKEEGGMDFNHLKESNAKLGDIVEELADEGQILVIRNKEGNPRVLFHNDMQYNTPIDAEFQKMWSEIPIPDETDLPKKLESAGLKTMEVFENKVTEEPKIKRSKARNRKIKITNTHLSHIDLSKDYHPTK
ncbi:hypothetical protein VTP01DRAFT_7148 [Rhizomucor pusillus]|uniref:uncharacterized protein n=1 Tax=Rhizomucor pusillus TaxID=4840 RepID=UPI0037427412